VVTPRKDVSKRYIPALSSRPAYRWVIYKGLARRFRAASLASPKYVSRALPFSECRRHKHPLKPANPVADCSHRLGAPSRFLPGNFAFR